MAIDVFHESLLSFAEVTKRLPRTSATRSSTSRRYIVGYKEGFAAGTVRSFAWRW